ncbi:MAG: hypothetical protein KGH72_03040 [Candidatus Micrarchaeota archaeon]|nr:hypothetical protein [Candidatus Micrarchaeota archaeon]
MAVKARPNLANATQQATASEGPKIVDKDALGRFLAASAKGGTFKEISRITDVSPQAVRARFKRMEAAGYLIRANGDHRITYTPTPLGEELFRDVARDMPELDMPVNGNPITLQMRADSSQRILGLFDEGNTPAQIHESTGLTEQYVRKVLLREGRIEGRKIIDLTREEVEATFDAGGTIREMAARLGIGEGSMARLLREHDLKKTASPTREQVEEAFRMGGKLDEMAKRVKVGRTRMAALLEDYGLREIRRRREQPITPEQVKATFDEGGTIREMGERIGITRGYMGRLLKRYGLKRVLVTMDQVESTFRAGGTLEEMADRIEVSRGYLAKLLHEYGLRERPKSVTREQVEEAFREGGTVELVSERIGRSRQHTSRLMERYGLREIKRKRPTPSQAEVEAAFHDTHNLAEMSAALGIGRKRASSLAKAYGLRRGDEFTKAQVEEAFRAGGTVKAMGERLEISPSRMARLLEKHRLRSIRRNYPKRSREEILEAHSSSSSIEEMRMRLRCGYGHAVYYIESLGLAPFPEQVLEADISRMVVDFKALKNELAAAARKGNVSEAELLGDQLASSRKHIERGLADLKRLHRSIRQNLTDGGMHGAEPSHS